jgi:hypothetical protein
MHYRFLTSLKIRERCTGENSLFECFQSKSERFETCRHQVLAEHVRSCRENQQRLVGRGGVEADTEAGNGETHNMKAGGKGGRGGRGKGGGGEVGREERGGGRGREGEILGEGEKCY